MTRHLLRLDAPADTFCDAFPLGNGSLGGMIYGQAGRERIDLNVDTFWSGGPATRFSDPAPSAALLPDLRQLIRQRRFAEADDLARRFQADGWTESYQPIGWLDWDYAEPAQGLYRRELDLFGAETRTVHHTASGALEVRSFVSRADDVLVVSITGAGLTALRGTQPELRSPHPTQQGADADPTGRWLLVSGRAPARVIPNYVDLEPAVVYAEDAPNAEGTVAAGMGFAVAAVVERSASEHRLIVGIETGFRGYDRRPSADLTALTTKARAVVAAARRSPTDELRRRHRADHRQYFDRVDLDLSGSLDTAGSASADQAELYFDVGRYLLISSSRPGTQAANLQGIWNADVRPGWSSNYTTNINVEMNYWGAQPLQLAEVGRPMLDLLDDLVAVGGDTARQSYGAAGAVAHHNTDLWRFTAAVNGEPVWSNWPSALPWMSAHLWDHLDHAAAVEEGELQHALEVFRQIAAFTLDMLTPGPDGDLVWSPSTSPEHLFVENDLRAAVSEGGSMDQELSREVLTRYLWLLGEDDSSRSSIDRELVGRCRSALERLRPVGTGSLGQLLEWYDERTPNEWGHRHLSHLYGVFPGTRITERDSPDEFEAARTALRIRLDNGSGYTGWSQAWVLCLAARFRDAELAERSIATLVSELSSESMLDFHPHQAWPGGVIFQIDGNLGAIAGMAELVVQGHERAVSLLKTLPSSWSHGRLRGVVVRGGHVVDVEWSDHLLRAAEITCGRAGTMVLDVPETTAELNVVDRAGTPVPHTAGGRASAGRRRLSWSAQSGETFRVAAQPDSG